MFNKYLVLMLLIVSTLTSSIAMDQVRVAGQASSPNVKNVNLDLTVRVYDISNIEIYNVAIPSVRFNEQCVFSFVWDASGVTYNPLYNVKLESDLSGLIVFECRLDKIVNAQSQYGALINPIEVDGSPDPTMVLTSDGTNAFWGAGGSGGGGGGASWLLGGNGATTPPTMFLGTLDSQPLIIKINNTTSGRIDLSNNTSLGLNSMQSVLTNLGNTGMGAEALYTLTSGTENTATGYQSMYSNNTGNYNTADGVKALYANGAGMANTATGYGALYSNVVGGYNTAAGYYSLFSNSTGTYNTATGYFAMHDNTSGAYNAALGYNALYYLSDGNANVGMGWNAGSYKADGGTTLTSALNSVYIGTDSKGAMTANTNEIVIGYNAIGGGSNSVVLGNTDIEIFKCIGAFTATTGNAPNLYVAADGQIMRSTAGTASSAPTIVTGAGSPIALGLIPGKIGDLYVDTASSAHYVYMAYGTAAGEWTQLN